MFGYIKMAMTMVLIAGIAGAAIYVNKLRSDNAILKANQVELERSIGEQTKLLEQQKKDIINQFKIYGIYWKKKVRFICQNMPVGILFQTKHFI